MLENRTTSHAIWPPPVSHLFAYQGGDLAELSIPVIILEGYAIGLEATYREFHQPSRHTK